MPGTNKALGKCWLTSIQAEISAPSRAYSDTSEKQGEPNQTIEATTHKEHNAWRSVNGRTGEGKENKHLNLWIRES